MTTAVNTIIFDLDGTLLDTLEDLANSVNYALKAYSLPARSTPEIRSFLGNGIRNLMQQSVPQNTPPTLFEDVFNAFRSHYIDHCLDKTQPYPDILDMLEQLSQKGVKMAIVSNKLQPAVTDLSNRFFARFISTAVGESATVRRKPNPDAVEAALKKLGSDKEHALYVGDSEVDIETARNAGLRCISVLWGFRDEAFMRQRYPNGTYINSPKELMHVAGM